ncbi:substrate-binding periplasmic protein [Marinobacter bohaiensis]|uniref:substrate-binding periplasmic protein n=1 Tax=Marinobacter bohaiensis TaxID=2201898 RepID=UPI000DADA6E4|nr:transporter substrate-binding domain-containing protein [Marinobacter bohaiensis]
MRLLLTICLILTSLTAQADRQRVVVGVNHAPPYRIIEDGHIGGFYIDVFNEIGRQLDWEIVYREAPFRRLLKLMEDGQVDVMLGPVRTPERETYMAYVAQAFPAEQRLFFYQQPENRITEYGDLAGKTIGMLRGSAHFPRFDRDDTLDKAPATRYRNLMQMLAMDHVDVVIAPELMGLQLIDREGLDVHVSPYTVPGKPAWIAVSRRSPMLQQQQALRTTLDRFRQTPRYHNLLLRYRSGITGEPATLQVHTD